jgi:hypothetical protein
MTLQNGGEWCYAHKRYEPLNDQIDFPVSDTFLGYFYRNGQTHRAPPDYFLRDREIQDVKADFLPRAEELMAGLHQEIKNLKRELELMRQGVTTRENGGKREIQI